MQSANSLELEQAQVYLFEGQKCRSMPGFKWTLIVKAHLLNLTDQLKHSIELGQQVVRIVYKETQGFYIQCNKAYFVLHLPLHHAQEEAFEYKLAENGVILTEFARASPETQKDIKKVCRSTIEQDPSITGKSLGSEIGQKIGGVFGAINNMFSKPIEKVDKGYQEGKDEAKDKVLGEEGKSKWQKFKDKAREVNKGAANAIKPVKDKMSEIKKQIGEKFQTSDNTAIKGIRQFGYGMRDSLNDGYQNYRFSHEEKPDSTAPPTEPPAPASSNEPQKQQQPAELGQKEPQSDRNLQ